MYKRVLCALSVIILTLCITGCKSTPGDSLIVNKTDDNINSLIGQHADGPVITDGHIKENITCCGDRVLANVDADIKSKFDYYGVYEIKRKEITQQQVDKAIKLLYGDNKIYNYRGQILTKESYDFYIDMDKKQLQDMKNNPKKYEDELKKLGDQAGYKTVDEWMRAYEKSIKEDTEARKTAPTMEELKNNLNTKLHYGNEKTDGVGGETAKIVMISTDFGFEEDSLFAVQVPNNQLEDPVMMSYKNGAGVGESTINTMTKEKAEKIAEEFALAMDSSFLLTYSAVEEDCYSFQYSITADGMPITKSKAVSEYSYNWNMGRITINVDDSGICAIDWTQPIEVVKKVTDKVEMITAEEAYEIFARYFKLKYASDSIYEYGIEKQIFDLYEISVSYVIEPIKDSTDAARVMPCWNFICKHTVKFNDGTPDNIAARASIFAINAIDKSIIL
jgi:hypothetical protein